jgi:thymidylate kinase
VADRGVFVCFEGCDGAGKTSTSEATGQYLRAAGLDVEFFEKKDDQFDDPIVADHMRSLRKILWGHEVDPYYQMGGEHWLHLMAAWYSTLQLRRLDPALAKHDIVICDSWIYKFMARLHTKRELHPSFVEDCFSQIRRPDIVIYLDVPPEVALERKGSPTPGESGNVQGAPANGDDFIKHQVELSTFFTDYSNAEGWLRVDGTIGDMAMVAQRSADVIIKRCGVIR